MSESTFLTRVVLENYKSIAACDVRLGPLTFLVGPNGAGKSNFLDALHLVSDALTRSLEQAIRDRGGIRALMFEPAGASGRVRIHLTLRLPSGAQGEYGFALGVSRNGSLGWRWEVIEEECRVTPAGGGPPGFFQVRGGQVRSSAELVPAPTADRLYLVRASGVAPFREMYDSLCDMHVYQFQPRSIPDIDTYDPGHRLRSDGSNLANVLWVIEAVEPATKERIEEFLRVVLPTLRRVSVEPVSVERPSTNGPAGREELNADKIALVFHQQIDRSAALFGPAQMSEGIMRLLAILTALYQVGFHELRPTLTAIEDVEAAVHPAELTVLLDALEEASLSTQVIVTTQSSDLLDKREVPLESVLVVRADQGVTTIGPLDEAGQSVVRQRLYSIGELLRIGQVRPESLTPNAPSPEASPT
jgi:predicted ATPase